MKEDFDKKIHDALNSIDDVQKAAPRPFFFTRLEARMQQEKNIWEKITSFVARPVITFACICLVIMINAIVIFTSSNSNKFIAQQNSELQTVDEYTQASATLYDLETIKP